MKADKEKERLRKELKRQKDKAVKVAAATSALLQLNAPHAPLLLPALVVAPLPIPPHAPLASSLQLPPIANQPSHVEAPPPKRRKTAPPPPPPPPPLHQPHPPQLPPPSSRSRKPESTKPVNQKTFSSRTTEMVYIVGASKADLAAHVSRMLVQDNALARAVLSNEALLAKIGSKGFLPKDVLNKLQSGQGSWSLFDCAVLKMTGKLSNLAWIVFTRRFKCLASLGSVRQELKRLMPTIVGIWIGGQEEEVDEVGNEEEELQEINYELEEGATEEERLEAQAADQRPPSGPRTGPPRDGQGYAPGNS